MSNSRSPRPTSGSNPTLSEGTDKALHESSARLHGVLESLADGFFTLDGDWQFTYLNAACERLLRRRRENLIGRQIGAEFPGAPGDVFYENYRRALDEKRIVEFEAVYGPLALWLEVRVHPTEEGLAVVLRDVSERRREREALRESVERFRGVARVTSDAIWDWNIGEDVTWWSEGMEKLFGHSLAAMEDRTSSWSLHIHEDDRNRVLVSIYNAVQGTAEEWSQEYRFGRADGTWAWVLDRAFLIRDAQRRAVRMVGGMKDLTKRREAELELARLNRALHMRSACSEAVIRASDETELLTEVCRIAVEIGGYRMAWVGRVDSDEACSIRPAAHAGFEDGYLSEVRLSALESLPGGRGPAGRAVRRGQPEILEDLRNTPAQTPWQTRALSRGYRGIVSLPLRDRTDTFGVLGLYTAEVRPINEDEVALLQNLADDLAFGVVSLRSRRERERMQVAVSKMASVVSAHTTEDFFDQLVRSMCEALGADLGYIAVYLPGMPRRIRAIAAVLDGRAGKVPDLLLEGRPSDALRTQQELVVPTGVVELYPAAVELVPFGIDGYVGRRLDNSRGVALGVVAALFREPIVDVGFATSTLRIFAARAAAELERHRLETLKVKQTEILERIAAGAPLSEVAEAAVRLVESQIAGAMSGVAQFEEEGRVLRLLAG
ncbi:MAG: GAF domain-containing protein, partial [Candidatus Binatia bacterium]